MVSRSNLQKKAEQQSTRRPHYGLRKLSVGVASVLLGTTLYLGGVTVEAHAAVTENAFAESAKQNQSIAASPQQEKANKNAATTNAVQVNTTPQQSLNTTQHPASVLPARSLSTMKATNPADDGDSQISRVTESITNKYNNKTIQEQFTINTPNNGTSHDQYKQTYSPFTFEGASNTVHSGEQVITTSGTAFFGTLNDENGNALKSPMYNTAYLNGKVLFLNSNNQVVLETTPGTLTDQQIAKVLPPAEFAEKQIHQYGGYDSYYSINGGEKIKAKVVPAQIRQCYESDIQVNITYQPIKKHTLTVNFVDDDEGQKKVTTYTTDPELPGHSLPLSLSVPHNYRLVTGQLPNNYTFVDHDETLTIHLVHQTQPSSRSTGVTRTIRYHGAGSQTPSNNEQRVDFTQTGTTDLVTGNTVWNNVASQTYPAFTVPTVEGYHTNLTNGSVPSATVNFGDQNSTVDVNYLPDNQTGHIIYEDQDNHNATVGQTLLQGTTGSDVVVNLRIPTGYAKVPGQNIPGTVQATASGIPDVIVYVQHKTTTVTPDNPKTTKDPLPDNPGKDYPDGVDHDSLNHTVTRTIIVHDPHTGDHQTVQTVNLTRKATVDEVTGKTTYTDWSTGTMPKFNTPSVAGYTPSRQDVDAEPVTVDYNDPKMEISYTPNPHSTKLSFQDDQGTPVGSSVTVNGKTDETKHLDTDYQMEVPDGWELDQGQTIPGEIAFGPDGHADVVVKIHHKKVDVTSDQPKTTNDPLPDNPGKNYPGGVDHDSLNHMVTRTIIVHDPHTGDHQTVQTIHLTRTATVDEVTGKTTYTDWSTGTMPKFTTPNVAGYTPSRQDVDAEPVTVDYNDTKIEISYTPNPHSTKLSFQDDQGTPVGNAVIVDGKTDETKKRGADYQMKVPDGWELDQGQEVPAEIAFGPDGHDDVVVKIHHKQVEVTPDQPKTTNDPLPDNPGKKYPSGVDHDDLNQTITRTIIIHDPHTGDHQTVQTVNLTRTATVDEVTGKVTYTPWSTGTMSKVDVPTVAGYTPSQKHVPAVSVKNGDHDSEVDVTYEPDQQTGKVSYVDGRGHEVTTTPLTGKTDETVQIKPKVPAGWKMIPDQEIPTEETVTPEGIPTVKVLIEHTTTTVQPTDPKTNNDPLPDNPGKKYPSGVDHDDLNRTITRTINLHLPDGSIKTIHQDAHLTRTATVDEVDGQVVYSSWTTADWSEYLVPTISGYTASQAVISAIAVTEKTAPVTVDVYYHELPQAMLSQNGTSSTITKSDHSNLAQKNVGAQQEQQKLPQTGNHNAQSTLGLGLSALLMMIGLLGDQQRKNH
ncbi:mucin-binding protein [uncultured Limosilactobacillus sp.]|uniref:mucin-binding protein n=1 Tax=uncultured Limosilactobacillus sp. TaxID=2837629 RepID=UPI002601459A|nr:YSIRK-type signal peptide-containing protein [uncultured Limosilactobacillus sp.]